MSKENYKIVASCVTESARDDIIGGLSLKKTHIRATIRRMKRQRKDEEDIKVFRNWMSDIDHLIGDIRKIPEC